MIISFYLYSPFLRASLLKRALSFCFYSVLAGRSFGARVSIPAFLAQCFSVTRLIHYGASCNRICRITPEIGSVTFNITSARLSLVFLPYTVILSDQPQVLIPLKCDLQDSILSCPISCIPSNFQPLCAILKPRLNHCRTSAKVCFMYLARFSTLSSAKILFARSYNFSISLSGRYTGSFMPPLLLLLHNHI